MWKIYCASYHVTHSMIFLLLCFFLYFGYRDVYDILMTIGLNNSKFNQTNVQRYANRFCYWSFCISSEFYIVFRLPTHGISREFDYENNCVRQIVMNKVLSLPLCLFLAHSLLLCQLMDNSAHFCGCWRRSSFCRLCFMFTLIPWDIRYNIDQWTNMVKNNKNYSEPT